MWSPKKLGALSGTAKLPTDEQVAEARMELLRHHRVIVCVTVWAMHQKLPGAEPHEADRVRDACEQLLRLLLCPADVRDATLLNQLRAVVAAALPDLGFGDVDIAKAVGSAACDEVVLGSVGEVSSPEREDVAGRLNAVRAASLDQLQRGGPLCTLVLVLASEFPHNTGLTVCPCVCFMPSQC